MYCHLKSYSCTISDTIHWLPKFATGLNMIIGCSSKSMWVMKLFFCQNDPLMGEPFWQNNSLVSHILFELQPIIIFSPVANFGNQSLAILITIFMKRNQKICQGINWMRSTCALFGIIGDIYFRLQLDSH